MTPKEALRKIKVSIATYLNKVTKLGIERHLENLENDTCLDVVSKAINELETLKKPPTVDELCMELGRYYKEQVSYRERHNHMFYFEKSRLGIVTLRDGNIVFIQGDFHQTNNLSPRLVTLIGRFYEGVVKQND